MFREDTYNFCRGFCTLVLFISSLTISFTVYSLLCSVSVVANSPARLRHGRDCTSEPLVIMPSNGVWPSPFSRPYSLCPPSPILALTRSPSPLPHPLPLPSLTTPSPSLPSPLLPLTHSCILDWHREDAGLPTACSCTHRWPRHVSYLLHQLKTAKQSTYII